METICNWTFEGDVRFNFDGVEICCQRAKYDEFGESDLLAMEGDVAFTFGQVEMRADSVTLSEVADNIVLIGNAKVIQNEQAKSFAAQKIVYNLVNETVKLNDAPDQHSVPLGFESHFEAEDGQVLPTAYFLEDDVQYHFLDSKRMPADGTLPKASEK